jgi:AraC-like DNA-binding protein
MVSAVAAAPTLETAAERMDTALRPLLPAVPDPAIALADRAVSLLAEDRTLTRVPDLARRLHLSTRSLQRLFTDYVGLPVGWVLRRYRLHEVAVQALSGQQVDWSSLANDLGYADQAHLVRDFTAAVGTSPARYAAQPDLESRSR